MIDNISIDKELSVIVDDAVKKACRDVGLKCTDIKILGMANKSNFSYIFTINIDGKQFNIIWNKGILDIEYGIYGDIINNTIYLEKRKPLPLGRGAKP